jgi:hypothetical protein
LNLPDSARVDCETANFMLVYVLEILPTDKLPIRENGATFFYTDFRFGETKIQ